MFVLHLRDECGSTHEVDFEERPDESDIQSECEDWCKDGEWGDEGAVVDVWWSLKDDDEDEEIDEGFHEVEIPPNHSVLISRVCGDSSCGNEPEDHDWTAEGEGGCSQNPGVWSTGGTSLTVSMHCRDCGLHRTEYITGAQKNPGEHDSVTYEMPDSWCEDCQNEDCTC